VIDPLNALIRIFDDAIVGEHSGEGVISLEAPIDCEILPIEHIFPWPGLIEAIWDPWIQIGFTIPVKLVVGGRDEPGVVKGYWMIYFNLRFFLMLLDFYFNF
jgi:hypothetical protein